MNKGFRIPLSAKLFAFVLLVICGTIAVNSWQNIEFIKKQLSSSLRANLIESSSFMASGAMAVLESATSQITICASLLSQIETDKHVDVLASLVKANAQFVAGFSALESESAIAKWDGVYVRQKFDDTVLEGGSSEELNKLILSKTGIVKNLFKDNKQVAIHNLTPQLKRPLIAVGVAFQDAKTKRYLHVVLVMWQTRLMGTASMGSETTYLVSTGGELISSSKLSNLNNAKVSDYKAVYDYAVSQDLTSGVYQWGQDGLAAFKRLRSFGLIAIVVGSQGIVNSAVETVIQRTIYWTGLIILIALAISYILSLTMTKNLRKLTIATQAITDGKFGQTVNIRTRDEVGELGQSVNFMSQMIQQQIAQQIEMARIEQEVEMAQLVQKSFVPDGDKIRDYILLSSINASASECGGDWWQFFKLNERYRLFCIADATGHGLPAALVTAMISTGMHVLSGILKQHQEIQPEMLQAMIHHMNSSLCSSGHGRLTLTFQIALIDLEKSTALYLNCGHNPPLHLKVDKKNNHGAIMLGGTPLGFHADIVTKIKTISFTPGDRMIFYTDGMFETTNKQGECWGKKRFRASINEHGHLPIDELKSKVVEELQIHLDGNPIDDDVTMVVIEFPGSVLGVALDETA